MKRLFWVILVIFFTAGAADAHRPHGGRHYGLFYGSLSPHGEWIEMSFGTVWRPYHVGHHWRPYMKGRWIWTDYGWYWNSYEPFGWATYHYGRWIYDDYYGWIWVPDDVWGPAWVEWRYSDDYVGWAPLPPYATFSISVGITFGQPWVAPVHYWNFVPYGNFSSAHVVNYIQAPDVSNRIYGRTRHSGSVRTVDRRIVNDGVGLDRIERRSRERISKVDIIDRTSPGEDRVVKRNERERLEVYRPGPEEVRRERSGQRSQDEMVRERNSQRSQEEVRRERSGQRTQEEVQRARDGQRPLQETMRERVNQRDRRKEAGRGVDKPKPEVKRELPAVEKPKLEIKRPKPEVRREGTGSSRSGAQEQGQPGRQSGRRGRDG